MTADLVERAQRGDHAAFDALATAAYSRLYAIAARILRDPYAAEDAVQDALVRAWRDLRAVRDPERFDAWLHRLLVHACADEGRKSKRRRAEVTGLELDPAEQADDVRRVADRDELERAFLQLSVEHRSVLVLVHYAGIPAVEVAQLLGVPTGTVASRLHYATRQMRAILERPSPLVPNPEQHR
jgi:RNA polymerase sigma-70 factor (ECF subfamily)